MSSPENVAFKQREQAAWGAVAPGWREHDTRLRESCGPVTERMLAQRPDSPRVGPQR